MGITEATSSPSSPNFGRVRRSLPEFQGDSDPRSAALSAKTRRSFRTPGRSSHSTSSEKSPFGTASARSSLRSSISRGSPSPARKLTTPQGPNLATAGRQRQCRCSETHHHGHHGHVTPVVPRVPLERERACRRSHGSNIVEDSKAAARRRASSRGSDARTSVCSHQSSTRDHSASPEPQQRRESFPLSPSPSLSSATSLRRGSVASSDAGSTRGTPTAAVAQPLVDESAYKPAERKGSVTTLVNWVPWLAEKRFFTTLKIPVPQPPVLVATSPRKKSITETHHFKVIHTSSSATPSFAASIGAPPGGLVTRLSMA